MPNRNTNFDLGIIGGAGPLIASKFSYELLKAWQRSTNAQADEDFPRVLNWNNPWKGIDTTGISDYQLAERYLEQTVAELTKLGVKRWVIPCLSAYDLKTTQQPNSIDWLGGVVRKFKHQALSQITLLTSESTKKQRKLEELLNNQGFNVKTTNDSQQTTINQLISQGMTGSFTIQHHQLITQLETELTPENGRVIWWGCTELSFIPPEILSNQSIQTIPIMVEACLQVLLDDRQTK